MTLHHYSEDKFVLDREQSYTQRGDHFKPNGLWVSDESDYGWKQWATAAEFRPESFVHEYEVILKPKGILYITSLAQMYTFSTKYHVDIDIGFNVIDWHKVAQDHKGIIITPYQYQIRMDDKFFWYYGWDCASGCIWDLSAIKSFTHVRHSERVSSNELN